MIVIIGYNSHPFVHKYYYYSRSDGCYLKTEAYYPVTTKQFTSTIGHFLGDDTDVVNELGNKWRPAAPLRIHF